MTDVFFADQICYLKSTGTINRDHAVCFGIQNAMKVFSKTYLNQFYDQVTHEGKQVADATNAGKSIIDPDFPQTPYTSILMREAVVDYFLVGTFFELSAKAFILSKDMLVHKINSKNAPSEVKLIAVDQPKKPVKIDDYLALDSFADFDNVGRNGLKYLKNSTLDYGWLYKNDYLSSLPFSEEFSDTATAFQVLRNQIHFPLAGASEEILGLQMKPVDVRQLILKEVGHTIRPLFESLNKKHSFNLSLVV